MRVQRVDITLPQLDAAAEVTIERYYVETGSIIEPGQALVMVRSDRFIWDLPATAAGTVIQLMAQPGATIAVGTPLVRLAATEQQSAPQPPRTVRKLLATPLACKIAAIHGLDLAAINGSGYGGRIMQADVLSFVESRTGGRPTTNDQRLRSQPSTLSSQHTALSARDFAPKSDAPYALTAVEVDLSRALAILELQQVRMARRGIKVTLTACIAHAVVGTLAEHRLINSAWSDDGLIVWGRIHLGVTVAAHDELITTVVQDAAELSLLGLARRLDDLTQPERSGAPTNDDMVDATFSVAFIASSIWSHALLSPTQAAHLSIGAIRWQPWVLEGKLGDSIAIRPVAILILTYDARAITPPQADAFVCAVKRRLEHLCCL